MESHVSHETELEGKITMCIILYSPIGVILSPRIAGVAAYSTVPLHLPRLAEQLSVARMQDKWDADS